MSFEISTEAPIPLRQYTPKYNWGDILDLLQDGHEAPSLFVPLDDLETAKTRASSIYTSACGYFRDRLGMDVRVVVRAVEEDVVTGQTGVRTWIKEREPGESEDDFEEDE